MSRYLLDTNICIYLMKGDFDLDNKVEQVGLRNCFISELTIAELLYGIANSAPDRQASNRQNLNKFLLLFPKPRRLALSAALETYATQKAQLKRIGRLQGEFDMLIGSTALAHGLTLVTRNTRHFADMLGLALEDWTIEQQAEDQSVNIK
ncbi:type II toxin-antitoxin system VapC family toxin [Hymenobacter ruricola]|uniref:Ribonuclease VapC n=1 Tax=Hymenobacter ruricola TaxID=2791023 RepID=A0ABS0I989_9BACT|nr:type II toxin-antitoxin system VapC family toxin [Hymenobacter ruricola]MBF9223142.1 type II toxin-antitoxin system VapC family toxin [Hymenobacter ruricola]